MSKRDAKEDFYTASGSLYRGNNTYSWRLRKKGIGRPSTYAPTITTILARHYITKKEKSVCDGAWSGRKQHYDEILPNHCRC